MTIEIINPRRVFVTLSCTKRGLAYQVDKSLRSFLEGRGWMLQKVGKSYATMTPPDGIKAPFVFNVDIPTRDQVVAVAQERHIVQEPWAGKFGEWIAVYIPPRSWTSTQIDPFTGQAISAPKSGGIISASFCIGFRLFWHAEVLFPNGRATYYESESQPIQSQIADFVSSDEILLEPESYASPVPDFDALNVASEGGQKLMTHLVRERSRAIVTTKRQQVLTATGQLACEACGFNFKAFYGTLGEGSCEVHHRVPLSEVDSSIETRLDDLAILCSNCHRMIHRVVPFLTVEELKTRINNDA